MSLSPGDQLGHYEIVSAIGAGGMGEVYKARVPRLDRTVAIKVLPDHIAKRDELRARFEREARAVASLNHPNICVLHDIGPGYMVMELIEGETLADRIAKGALPFDQALQHAGQIADALDRAHRAGVTHRDIKPQNIMLTRDGVKILDFGLAKSTPRPGPTEATLTAVLTTEGTVMGTPQYMAPELFEGKEGGPRGDVWAFGAVLYEMVTGQKAFQGKSYSSLVGAILSADPPPMAVQPFTPAWLERLVRRCLAKDPEDRWQSMRDIVLELRSPPVADGVISQKKQGKLPWIVAAGFAVAAIALGVAKYRQGATAESAVMRMSILPPAGGEFEAESTPAISPDGRMIVFESAVAGKRQLWLRDLDSMTARPLPGTEDGYSPFWSPDSASIAFFLPSIKLKKIDVAGGPAITVCATPGIVRGGSWTRAGRDVILFATRGEVYQVPAAGGDAAPLPNPEKLYRSIPRFLPDGRHFLVGVLNRQAETGEVHIGDLDTGSSRRLISDGINAIYVPPRLAKSGAALFVRERTLMAQPFDAAGLLTTGEPVPVAEDIRGVFASNRSIFTASQTGILVYRAGGGGGLRLTWFDRAGREQGFVGAVSSFRSWPALSPDGTKVATDREPENSTAGTDIWVHDLARGSASRFTFGPTTNIHPVWSGDGTRIAFYATRDGKKGHPFQRTLGGGKDEVLGPSLGDPPENTRADDWSRDGRYLVAETARGVSLNNDIWVLPLFGDKKPIEYLRTKFNERQAKLSPNGNWLAYLSDETGRFEIYVQSFPTPGGKVQVSSDGGSKPVWSRDGKELFFIGPDQKMMAVDVKTGAKFEAGPPKALFTTRIGTGVDTWFDVAKDGRFLIPTQPEEATAAPLTVVLNWDAAWKAKLKE